jgi:hypothetical protein
MLKKIVRGFSSISFKFLLFATTTVVAIVFILATPIKLKIALKNSGVYSSFIDSIAAESQKQQNKQQGPGQQQNNNSVSFSQAEIVAAAKQAFPPSLLQDSVEKVIDGFYGWAQGKTTAPQFSIDLAPIKQNFAESVGDAAATRLKSLPVCTKAQLQQLSNGDINPFTVVCLPPGFNIENERKQLINEIANNKDLLEKPTITADSLPKDNQGRTFAEQFAQVPKLYRWATLLPWILGGLTLFFAGMLVWLYDSKRRAIRSISSAFVSAGVFLIISYLVVSWLMKHFTKPKPTQVYVNQIQQNMTSVVQSLTNDLNTTIIKFAVGYLIFGTVGLLVLWLTRKKHVQPKHHEANAHIHSPDQQTPPEPITKPEDQNITNGK